MAVSIAVGLVLLARQRGVPVLAAVAEAACVVIVLQVPSMLTSASVQPTRVVSALQQRMNSTSGVNIDTEMANLISLQNTYAANAHVMSVVQTMMSSLMQVQL